VDLGLSLAEFWTLTPGDFLPMLRRMGDRDRARRRDHYALVATLINVHGGKVTVEELMGEKPKDKAAVVRELWAQLKPDGK
jgi:hypothetical protein